MIIYLKKLVIILMKNAIIFIILKNVKESEYKFCNISVIDSETIFHKLAN